MRTRIQHGAVAETATLLALAVRGLEDELTTLDEAAALLRGSWSGEARDAYDRAHRAWTTELTAMKDALADTARRLTTVNQISMGTSRRAAGVWA
ncbi:WXG100 family type VII secretion target [Microbacterium sp. 22242]|uniref:WXG100 family type VII secretion target n=1 Tax=Microbacterium sp. 22242 TaxID=3453896 RepID=UPI003F8300A7